jgi:hypothetical protein
VALESTSSEFGKRVRETSLCSKKMPDTEIVRMAGCDLRYTFVESPAIPGSRSGCAAFPYVNSNLLAFYVLVSGRYLEQCPLAITTSFIFEYGCTILDPTESKNLISFKAYNRP